MFQFLSYFEFLIFSTNQHGVHSPFVYNFVTKGLYRKREKNISLKEHVLITAISYFNYKSIAFVSADDYIKNKMEATFDQLKYDSLPYDLIYMENNSTLFTSISKENYHNNTMVFLNGMYKSRERKATWEKIKKLPEVTVTIDLFYCGLIFFRREQAKEHFKIRI